MLKGVHHQIIEIRQTEDPYFERALLFVRADCAETSEDTLGANGRCFLKKAQPHTGLRRARFRAWLRYGASMACGAILTMVLMKML